MSGSGAHEELGQEFSGKSVEEATAEGLRRLGLRAEDAEIEVVNRGSRGLFGIGSEPAVVRIRRAAAPQPPRPAPQPTAPAVDKSAAEKGAPKQSTPPGMAPEAAPQEAAPQEVTPQEAAAEKPAAAEDALAGGPSPERDAQVTEMAGEMLETIVRLMGFSARVDAEWRDADAITDDRHLLLGIHGPNLSALIGRRGETLESLQYLLRLMVNQKMHRWLNIVVDVEDYRAKRVEHLTHLAQRMADQVATTGRSFALEPMPPNERRIVHLALRDHPSVFTESTGDAERRKVNIFPRK